MTVRELIVELQAYDQDRSVLVTWEGIFRGLTAASVYPSPHGPVVIDADNNYYRDIIVAGKLSPRPEHQPHEGD